VSRLNIITTKFGDSGKTNLVNRNVSKASKIIECIGSIDEANSTIGVSVEALNEFIAEYKELLHTVQNNLFDLGADIILNSTKINAEHISFLEGKIDEINKTLPPLQSFILPIGKTAIMHQARSVVRRAERAFWRATAKSGHKFPGVYLNRLSDLLFVVCRAITHKHFQSSEEQWVRIGNGK